jgi:PTS system mannose-specific IIB component/fructoselysine and glucoselysine-specific PTS system IIB component
MPIVLCRIDDRLVHGQVVVGWGRPLEIDRIVLVDDAVAASEFECDLYRMAVPEEMDVEFTTTADAPARIAALAPCGDRVLVLTGSVAAMAALARSRPGLLRTINVGGLHDAPGRREYLRYVYATDEELADLRALAAEGIDVRAQDLPDTRPVPVAAWTEHR